MFKLIKLIMLMSISLLLVFSNLNVYSQSDIKVIVNGKTVKFDVTPVVKAGRTLVPFRQLFEALGAEVSWDAGTGTVKATKNSRVIVLKVGEKKVVIDDQEFPIAVAPEIVNGRTIVPLRVVSENCLAFVSWDGKTGTVNITTTSCCM